MSGGQNYVVFSIGDERLACLPPVVDRVVHAVAVAPTAPSWCGQVGVIDMQGEMVPVLDLRPALGVPTRPLSAKDQFLVVIVGASKMALWVDTVEGVRIISPPPSLPADGRSWPSRLDEGVVTVYEDLSILCPPSGSG